MSQTYCALYLFRSIDSAAQRAAEAEANLRDFGDEAATSSHPQQHSALPSALAAFSEV